jgi:hypothetical protein
VAALAEKIELSTVDLDAQAIGNALFGMLNSVSVDRSCSRIYVNIVQLLF